MPRSCRDPHFPKPLFLITLRTCAKFAKCQTQQPNSDANTRCSGLAPVALGKSLTQTTSLFTFGSSRAAQLPISLVQITILVANVPICGGRIPYTFHFHPFSCFLGRIRIFVSKFPMSQLPISVFFFCGPVLGPSLPPRSVAAYSHW